MQQEVRYLGCSRRGHGTASTGSPTAIPSPSEPASTPGSSTGQTGIRLNRSLAKNSIYAIDLGDTRVSCKVKVRSPQPPLTDANLASYGKKLVGCLVKAFDKPLAAHGIELTTPKIKVYRNTIRTPCGRFGQKGAPAYCCSITRTIYWPVTGDDGARRTPSRDSGTSDLWLTNSATTCRRRAACSANMLSARTGQRAVASGIC